MTIKTLFFIVLLGIAHSVFAGGAGVSIAYPKPAVESDPVSNFPIQLLTLVLDKAGFKGHLLPSERAFPEKRSLMKLERKQGIDIVWSVADEEKESRYIAVEIPIYNGLTGWQVPIVNKYNAKPLDRIETVDQLQSFSVIQGSNWPSRRIFEENKFTVHHAHEDSSMYEMLSKGRGDILFSSVLDVWTKKDSFRFYGLKEDRELVVRFPQAMYFFVHKDNQALASVIKQGFEKSLQDGSYEKMFSEVIQPLIDKSELNSRRVIQVENPSTLESGYADGEQHDFSNSSS